MKFVLDSSVALKWVLPEIGSDTALQLREESLNAVHELLAPDILHIETLHALTKAERQKKISIGDGWKLWRTILSSNFSFHSHRYLLPRAYEIASAARIGIYDCLYVALAEQEGCELITSDSKLILNLRSMFPFILSLDAVP